MKVGDSSGPKLLEKAPSSDIMVRTTVQERCFAFDALFSRV
jgi:hypothetical protein